jgi:hypothetical protein
VTISVHDFRDGIENLYETVLGRIEHELNPNIIQSFHSTAKITCIQVKMTFIQQIDVPVEVLIAFLCLN